jgi:PAS domain S-box-containing protein
LISGLNETSLILLALGLASLATVFFAVLMLARRLRKKQNEPGATQVDFVVGTFHEMVSELKDKERELEELRTKAEKRAGIIEDYNENILQSVPSGVVSMDGSWKIVKVNSAAEKILGVRAGEAIGKDGREVFPEEFLKAARKRGESQYVQASGKRLWLGFTLTPLRDAEGSTIGQLLVFTDLTELKALESQAELRQRLSSLGEMAAGIAHELRNPMGVISGYMRLLGQRTDASLKQTVEAVSKEVSAMDRIINDFLSFARPGEIKPSEVNLSELIEDCVGSLRDALGDVGVSVSADGALAVRADEVLLRQALTNLLCNAREAMGQGGKIAVSCVPRGDTVEISVSDTGHGIQQGIRDKVFLPFYTTKEQGTGLGLAIVHRIVTDHGGSLDMQSGESGTTFRIRLPLLQKTGQG